MSTDLQARVERLELSLHRAKMVAIGLAAALVTSLLMGQTFITQKTDKTEPGPFQRYVIASVDPSVDGKQPGFAVVCDGFKERIIVVRNDDQPADIPPLKFREVPPQKR